MTPEQAAALRAQFPPESVGQLPKPYRKDADKGTCAECGGYHGLPAMHLDYVGHAAVTDRLLQADPEWSWEPVALDERGLPAYDNAGGLWIRLTVCGVTRLGYGDGPDPKQRIGDALRNAAMRFGVALDLWHKGGALHDDYAPAADAPRPTPGPAEVEHLRDLALSAASLDDCKAVWKRAAETNALDQTTAWADTGEAVTLAELIRVCGDRLQEPAA